MVDSPLDAVGALAEAVEAYRADSDLHALSTRLEAVCATATPEALANAAEPYRQIPEVAGPIYERIVDARPNDARALVILANAYWLSGRGAEAVGELASRAISADPINRGAWHLWALAEPSLRDRTARWQQVSERFPADDLARVNLADNAASLASTEHDDQALVLAIRNYESLLATAQHPEQREALSAALGVLRNWSF